VQQEWPCCSSMVVFQHCSVIVQHSLAKNKKIKMKEKKRKTFTVLRRTIGNTIKNLRKKMEDNKITVYWNEALPLWWMRKKQCELEESPLKPYTKKVEDD
jgi:hypothetical protein